MLLHVVGRQAGHARTIRQRVFLFHLNRHRQAVRLIDPVPRRHRRVHRRVVDDELALHHASRWRVDPEPAVTEQLASL